MLYVVKLILASVAALTVGALAVAITPWYSLGSAHEFVSFCWIAFVCVALPGLSWFAAMRLMRLL